MNPVADVFDGTLLVTVDREVPQMADNLEWHGKLAYDLENTNLSFNELARKYGRSRDTIIKFHRLHGILRRVPIAKGSKRSIDMVKISPEHKAIGVRLTIFRENRTYSEVAEMIGVSRHVLKCMELGVYELTLSQMLTISKLLGLSFVEMTTPFTMATPSSFHKVRA